MRYSLALLQGAIDGSEFRHMMSTHLLRFALLLTLAASASAQTSAGISAIPRLEKRGVAMQLIVEGKPFLVLGGELHNSSASSLAYMDPIWPKLAAMRLNTVLAPIYWELIEPEEGRFDFSLVDGLLAGARRHQLRLVLLWFGSWKNTYSSYVPAWVKKDAQRFPRVQLRDSRGTERLSPFSTANRDADAKAFAALMRHLRQADSDTHTVIMVQVENEAGVIPEARDHSPAADQAFAAPVPAELIAYLRDHRQSLMPEFRALWEAAGSRTSGTWEQVFGAGALTADLFMAWHYARYIQSVVLAGKKEHPLPMFVNAALIRPNYQPGQYNSGGPLPHSSDIWRAGAAEVDFLSPDIYFDAFADWSRQYDRSGNPLFVPEARGGAEGAANAFYAIGRHRAIGFSPFGIDSEPDPSPIAASYATLARLTPLILEKQASGGIAAAVLEGEAQRAARLDLGGYTFTVTRAPKPGESASTDRVAALFLHTGSDEFIVAGHGTMHITFALNSPGLPIAGIASIDEEFFSDGKWSAGRRLNGDENAQGQLLRLNAAGRSASTIYRVRLYRYR